MSSKNPFRHPVAAQPTAQEQVIRAPPSPPLPPLPQRTPSPQLPPIPPQSPVHSEMPTSSNRPSGLTVLSARDILEDDLPPPYTPAANVGEQTVGLGPRRPFQQPPPQPSFHPPPGQLPYSNWSQPGPGPSSGFYGQPNSQGLAPWQTQQQYRQRQKAGGGLIGALIDTVRDIADVVSGAHDERLMAARSANAGAYAATAAPYSNTHTVYASPSGPPPGQVYQPPPGPPPRPVSAPPQSSPAVPDDGSPTRTPVPGHPLLLDGNLLVYPKDYLCVKCKNTGYKNYDPSSPCRKCWDKYGRPYTGALTYTPWSAFGNDPRMQRALPRFVPPHLAGPLPGSSRSSGSMRLPPPPPPQHPHSRSVSQPRNVHSSGPGASYYVVNPLSPTDIPPVPDAIPVEPGDPRLGGWPCVQCDSAGIQLTSDDTTMCDNCGGTGRVWR